MEKNAKGQLISMIGKFKRKTKKDALPHILGLRVVLTERKFLWFSFYSKRELKITPGYFHNENKEKITLKEELIKSIHKPKSHTWYHVYLLYKNKSITDVIFDDILYKRDCSLFKYKRVASIFVNKKKRIQPFTQVGDWFNLKQES